MRMGHLYKGYTIETYISSEDGGYSADVDTGDGVVTVATDLLSRKLALEVARKWIDDTKNIS